MWLYSLWCGINKLENRWKRMQTWKSIEIWSDLLEQAIAFSFQQNFLFVSRKKTVEIFICISPVFVFIKENDIRISSHRSYEVVRVIALIAQNEISVLRCCILDNLSLADLITLSDSNTWYKKMRLRLADMNKYLWVRY